MLLKIVNGEFIFGHCSTTLCLMSHDAFAVQTNEVQSIYDCFDAWLASKYVLIIKFSG